MIHRRSILTGAALVCAVVPALAHDAPSGVAYPVACCSSTDCHPVDDRSVSRAGDGWRVETKDGPVIYRPEHLREPIDDRWHACHVPNSTIPLCIIPAAGGS